MFKKKDRMLMLLVLAAAGIMAIVMKSGHGQIGTRVRILIDGEEYGTYSLMDDTTIEVVNMLGYNKVVLVQGKAAMVQADCPDQYCVEHSAISKTNETIVCLPHKLVVEVLTSGEDNGIDSVAQ